MSLHDLDLARRDDGPLENVIYRTAGYAIADGRQTKSDWRTDSVTGLLLRDACGLTAEFDRDGQPVTVIEIMLRDPSAFTGLHRRPEVLDIARGKGQARPMGVGSIGRAEGCFRRNGIIQARWISRLYPDYDAELHRPLIGVVASVRPQGRRDGEQPRYFQNRYVLALDRAAPFSGLDGFRRRVVEAMEGLADWPGVPGFVLRGVDIESGYAVAKEQFRGWDAALRRPVSPRDTVARFLRDPDNAFWVKNLEAADANVLWEIIPVTRIETGAYSLPRARLDKARANGRALDDADLFRYDDSTAYRYETGGGLDYGFALSDVEVERKRTEDGFSKWYSTGTRPTVNRPALYRQAEVVTPNLPEALAARFAEAAAARGALRMSARRAARDPEHAGRREATCEDSVALPF